MPDDLEDDQEQPIEAPPSPGWKPLSELVGGGATSRSSDMPIPPNLRGNKAAEEGYKRLAARYPALRNGKPGRLPDVPAGVEAYHNLFGTDPLTGQRQLPPDEAQTLHQKIFGMPYYPQERLTPAAEAAERAGTELPPGTLRTSGGGRAPRQATTGEVVELAASRQAFNMPVIGRINRALSGIPQGENLEFKEPTTTTLPQRLVGGAVEGAVGMLDPTVSVPMLFGGGIPGLAAGAAAGEMIRPGDASLGERAGRAAIAAGTTGLLYPAGMAGAAIGRRLAGLPSVARAGLQRAMPAIGAAAGETLGAGITSPLAAAIEGERDPAKLAEAAAHGVVGMLPYAAGGRLIGAHRENLAARFDPKNIIRHNEGRPVEVNEVPADQSENAQRVRAAIGTAAEDHPGAGVSLHINWMTPEEGGRNPVFFSTDRIPGGEGQPEQVRLTMNVDPSRAGKPENKTLLESIGHEMQHFRDALGGKPTPKGIGGIMAERRALRAGRAGDTDVSRADMNRRFETMEATRRERESLTAAGDEWTPGPEEPIQAGSGEPHGGEWWEPDFMGEEPEWAPQFPDRSAPSPISEAPIRTAEEATAGLESMARSARGEAQTESPRGESPMDLMTRQAAIGGFETHATTPTSTGAVPIEGMEAPRGPMTGYPPGAPTPPLEGVRPGMRPEDMAVRGNAPTPPETPAPSSREVEQHTQAIENQLRGKRSGQVDRIVSAQAAADHVADTFKRQGYGVSTTPVPGKGIRVTVKVKSAIDLETKPGKWEHLSEQSFPYTDAQLRDMGIDPAEARRASHPASILGTRRGVGEVASAMSGGPGSKGARAFINWTFGKLLPKLRTYGDDPLNKGFTHAASNDAIGPRADVLIREVWGGKWRDAKLQNRVGAVLTESNLRGDREKFIQAGETEKAAAVKSLVGPDKPFATEADYQAALKDPTLQSYIQKHNEVVGAWMDKYYRINKGMAPEEPIEDDARDEVGRINLLRQAFAETVDAAVSAAGRASNIRRTRSGVTKASTGSAEGGYSIDYRDIIKNTVKRAYPEATLNEFFRSLDSSGAGKLVPVGEQGPEGMKKIEGYRPIPVPVRSEAAPGQPAATKFVGHNLFVKPELEGEVRRIANVDPRHTLETPGLQTAINILNTIQIAGPADASTHIANQLRAIARSQGAGGGLLMDLARRAIPGFGLVDGYVRLMMGLKELRANSLETQKTIAKLTELGVLRGPREGPDEGFAGKVPILKRIVGFTHDTIMASDKAAHLVLDHFYDNLRDRGWAEDSDASRRDFHSQMGIYNRRVRGALDQWMKDMGAAPFVVAAKTFTQVGMREAVGSPGYKATDWQHALAARAVQLSGTIFGTMTGAAIINYLLWGKALPEGVEIGSVKIGTDEKTKRPVTWNVNPLWRRGAGALGESAVLEGVVRPAIEGKKAMPLSETVDAAWRDMVNAIIAPFTGPAVHAATTAIGGVEPRVGPRGNRLMRDVPVSLPGSSQALEQGVGALARLNPSVSAFTQNLRGEGTPAIPTGSAALQTLTQPAEHFFGIRMGQRPQTQAVQFMHTLMSHRAGTGEPSGRPADLEAHQLRTAIQDAIREHGDVHAAIDAAINSGHVALPAIRTAMKNGKIDPDSLLFKSLTAAEAKQVMDYASPQEQANWHPDYVMKQAREFSSRTLAQDKLDKIRGRVTVSRENRTRAHQLLSEVARYTRLRDRNPAAARRILDTIERNLPGEETPKPATPAPGQASPSTPAPAEEPYRIQRAE
jgi:hypothetical protein